MTDAGSDRAEWMSGRWGVMVHWLAPGPPPERGERVTDLDAAVDGFDLDRFMADFARTGGEWLVFTIGQNTGHYASPNSVIERLAGRGRSSRRDLVMEIAERVKASGKRFIAYLPCEVRGNPAMHEGLGWNTEEGTDQRVFQERYTGAVREWAKRLGSLLDGWWFDGCYTWPVFDNRFMDWPLWYAAARAGNPDAALTFNDGILRCDPPQPVVPEHDYLAGEVVALVGGRIRLGTDAGGSPYLPESRLVPGTRCQWHALVPIDAFWGHGSPSPEWLGGSPFKAPPADGSMEPPAYSDADLAAFLGSCMGVGGAVTLNVGIFQEGGIGPETVAQLERVGAARQRRTDVGS